MSRIHGLLASLLLVLVPMGARAEGGVLAVIAPKDGPFAELGNQIRAGAKQLADEKKLKLTDITETCEAGSGTALADAIIKAKASAAIGFLCGDSLDGAGDALKAAAIPALSVSVHSKILFEDAEKEGWPFFTLAPSFEQQADKLAEVVVSQWQGASFSIIEDGTLPSRELADATKTRLEDKGLKPISSDTIRPGQENQVALLRRLVKAGVSHVLFTGERSDAAILQRDAASEDTSLSLLGGEAMNAADGAVRLTDGAQAVLLPEVPPSASALAETFRRNGIRPEGYVIPAYSAALIAAEAVSAAATSGKPVAAELTGRRFDTPLGAISFQGGQPIGNPYALMVWQGGAFQPVP